MTKIEKVAAAPTIAVTGGIACGKSEVGKILEGEGATLCDADDVARRQLVPGSPVFDRVVARFGKEILNPDGHVDRARLADRVFSNEEERAALNGITHPPVMDEIEDWAMLAKARGKVAVALVPLLFEAGAEKSFDVVVCVASDESIVLRRLQRRGLNENEARKRIAAQLPLAEKRARSKYVIENNGDLMSLARETKRVYRDILNKERDEHG